MGEISTNLRRGVRILRVNATIDARHSCGICNLIPSRKAEDNRYRGRNAWLNRRCSSRNGKITIRSRLIGGNDGCHKRQIVIGRRRLHNVRTKPLRHSKSKSLCKVAVTRWEIREGRRNKVRRLIGNPLSSIDHSIP